jgi:serine/threonine protein kinase
VESATGSRTTITVCDPVTTLFHHEIPSSEITNDYELQDLLATMRSARIEVDKMTLEPRIEEMIRDLPNVTPMIQVKLRIIYIIISLNLFGSKFQEIKRYRSLRSSRYFGVFRYNDYIIRIDDSPYSFINEMDVKNALLSSTTPSDSIVLPFLIYTNTRYNHKNNICECNPSISICDCKYRDNLALHPDMDKLNRDALLCYNHMRKDAVSFSIQRYVKHTVPLYNWVKDNFGSYVYSQFSNIQYAFFIHLFYKCASLFRTIHAAGIVHGDVKPDNILIREESSFDMYHPEKCKHFTVYLIDFGLSGIQGKGVGTGGTIPYCHPEFKNIVDTNRTSKYHWKILQLKHDIWSLGLGFLTLFIYRDYYNYYHKYPSYFFTKNGYVSSLILDVITHHSLNALFTKMMSDNCIPINEVCMLLESMATQNP